MKDIKVKDRLIFALDVPEVEQAKDLVIQLDDSVNFYKIGMELLMTGQYFNLLDWLLEKDKKVFVDLKFFDVPETVGRTIKRLSQYGATFATIHGNQALMEKAAENKGELKILAVTVLTSLDRGDLDDLGFDCDVQELVISRTKRAFEAGCDGVVSSGLEVPFLREYVDNKLIAVTPGIRPVANDDDQKRVVDVATAFNSGSDYIVVGRPIKNATSPYQAAQDIQTIIKGCF
ncbi:orotidine-5'-phosphate decarboxylase [Isorropodon fossajaponicum endosymbiont JTNG4]|uniref:orotidine-5'-phosphate decarboxylase n=1 Tax=Isorropodon fossajaponicum symbiont TaxID=883811 RepID=UPI00191628D6|nr:orotidine-5'-phosphate decarboxylase [Isorropodon fossajaponicum symbiont]BBB23573.1 orotidine-5'-phosphate decarboxylase [Isorropodon fossajaponicum endosymbiont JTNG4]